MPHRNQPNGNASIVRRRRLDPSGIIAIGLFLLLEAAATRADVFVISSIKDIVNGTTIDFEQPGNTANDILSTFDMTATPDVINDADPRHRTDCRQPEHRMG